jgi:hypothetical protein
MAQAKQAKIEQIRMKVEENGERFAYTFRGCWLVGDSVVGHLATEKDDSRYKSWSIARGEKGKLVVYCRDFSPDTFGSIIVGGSPSDLADKVPESVFQELEIALGLREKASVPERPLDV